MKIDLSSKYKTRSGIFRYLEALKPISQTNRRRPTKAESLFWNAVLRNDKTGHRFLRQKPLDRFILDFYCSRLLLAIEIDGGSHSNKEPLDYERDHYLFNLGIKTIRYTNKQVFTQLENIVKDLAVKIKDREIELNLSDF
jgi:very-short-patch-repair endonuclease